MKKKIFRSVALVTGIFLIVLILLSLIGTVAEATGLVDDTVKAGNLYSEYPLNNYQLDFFVDSSWDWLPWNWGDGLGKSVMFGLYAITNFIWTVSLYLSNATGYVVQEAYKLDFISDTANNIGQNIQTLAGINTNGFQGTGFYVGFLLLLVLIVGIYVTYTGLIKRETTKAVRAVINFVTIFLLSASFVAYAPSYITKINDFSSDVSQAALKLGTKIVAPNSEGQGKDSVDMIRDSLFSMQVQQPWLLLQYDNSNLNELGEERVNEILAISPDENKGKDREEAVKAEIEEHDNANLSITKTMSRLGTVVFLFLFNLGISFFIFLLTGIMLFSQILFIIFAMFLPISFVLSMVPTYESLAKKAIIRLFNTIMMRAGITLVITTAFSISTMFYTISASYPFFMVGFLQIVTFAGIYFKLGDIMSMFNLQSNDSQMIGKRIMRKPQMMANRRLRQLNRQVGRTVAFGTGALAGAVTSKEQKTTNERSSKKADTRTRGGLVSSSSEPEVSNKLGEEKGQNHKPFLGRRIVPVTAAKKLSKDQTVGINNPKRTIAPTVQAEEQKDNESKSADPADFKRSLTKEKNSFDENRKNQAGRPLQNNPEKTGKKGKITRRPTIMRENVLTKKANQLPKKTKLMTTNHESGYQTFAESNDPTRPMIPKKQPRHAAEKAKIAMVSPSSLAERNKRNSIAHRKLTKQSPLTDAGKRKYRKKDRSSEKAGERP